MKSDFYKISDKHGAIYEKYMIVAKEIGHEKKILELGCYDGSFCEFLKKNDNFVVGVEVDNSAFLIASKICDRAYQYDLNNPGDLFKRLSETDFDYVLLLDVLEHLINPENLLNDIKNSIKKDCHLLITIPNIAFWGIRKKLLFGHFEYTEVGILDSTHLKFYTYNTATAMFLKAGFNIVDWKPASYMAPLLGRIGLRKTKFLRKCTSNIENYLAIRFPNFFCSQIYFKLKLM